VAKGKSDVEMVGVRQKARKPKGQKAKRPKGQKAKRPKGQNAVFTAECMRLCTGHNEIHFLQKLNIFRS
jgi:hypothetical protein